MLTNLRLLENYYSMRDSWGVSHNIEAAVEWLALQQLSLGVVPTAVFGLHNTDLLTGPWVWVHPLIRNQLRADRKES